MPMIVANVPELNSLFHPQRIADSARLADSFAPGASLDASLVTKKGTVEHRLLQGYLDKLPGAVRESLRATLHHALTSSPPRQVTLAWAPAYDYEITIADAPCGITVLLKSRYPGDKEPNREDAAAS